MSRIYQAIRRAERESETNVNIRSVISPQADKEEDLSGEDVVAEAEKVARSRLADEEQDSFRPSNVSTILTDDRSSPGAFPGSSQATMPLDPLWSTRSIPRRSESGGVGAGILTESELTREEEIKLVQRVFLLPSTERPRTVIFCGVDHSSGCSWICARTAEILASQVPGLVCAVDTNLRSPTLHRCFGLDNHRGLTEAIFESGPLQDYTRQLPIMNLRVLTAGIPPADPHLLLTSKNFVARLRELQASFDHVLINAPPVNPYADATLLGPLADGVVLVIEANSTRRDSARKAKEALESAHSRVLAAVLDGRTFPIPEGIYRRL